MKKRENKNDAFMTKYKQIKNKTFKIINDHEFAHTPSKTFQLFIISLIVINFFTIILSTFQGLPKLTYAIIQIIESFTTVVFTIEYALRLWTADLLYPKLSRLKATIRYALSITAIIDLLAILPFYIPTSSKQINLKILRMVRVFRLFRIFELNRYINAFDTIAYVFKSRKEQLILSTTTVSILILISSVMMYYLEHDAQPELFKNAFSGFWWSIITVTTVGYGEIYPITPFGKILASFIAILGISFIAVPTGIISSGFSERLSKPAEHEASPKKPNSYQVEEKIEEVAPEVLTKVFLEPPGTPEDAKDQP